MTLSCNNPLNNYVTLDINLMLDPLSITSNDFNLITV